MKVKKKILSLLIAAVMLIGMLPMGAVTVMADTEDNISYCYYDDGGNLQSGSHDACTVVVSNSSTVTWNAGWYVVNSTVTISGRITVNGEVNLILADGSSLTASSGITVNSGNTLNIYGQTNNSGKLIATGGNNQAGIDGIYNSSSGTIRIDGGTIVATGGGTGAGIGGGSSGNGSDITINGGEVTAYSTDSGAGIGGGQYAIGTNITINGGEVTAYSNGSGAGIGGGIGQGKISSNITINGGTVNATGGSSGGAGIGGGSSGSGSYIYIYGGTVEATGGSKSAGIGGSGIGSGSYIYISGGKVTATGGSSSTGNIGGAGIGGGGDNGDGGGGSSGSSGSYIYISGGEVTATGGARGAGIGGGNHGSASVIEISGGEVTATGQDYGAGIGGGLWGSGSNITISGGEVTATGGYWGAGIGGGSGESGTNITISGANTYINATGGTDASDIGGGGNNGSSSNITITGGYFASDSTNSTVGAGSDGGKVYNVTVADTYSVCNNTEDASKDDYPYVVMSSSDTVTSEWISAGVTILKEVVALGSEVSQPANPADYSDSDCTYTFKEWDKTFVQNPTSDITYTAVFTATYKAPAEGVGYTIDYEAETAEAQTGYEISLNGTDWSKETLTVTPGGTLYVRRAETTGSDPVSASASTTNTIDSRPATLTDLQGVNTSFAGESDGKITGTTTDMEYKLTSESEWIACTADETTGLAAGDYEVRIKATTSSFASESANVTVGSGDERSYTLNVSSITFDTLVYGYDQPTAKEITISSTGNSDATIESVTVDSEDFIIETGDTTVTAGGTNESWTIQPKEGLSGGTHTSTITVTYDGGATATATVTFVVTPTYTLTVDLDGGSGDTDGGVYEEGTVVDIDAGSRSNYTFIGWTSSDGGTFGDASSASTTFTMPASDTTITANWQKKSSSSSGGSSHSLEQVTSSSSSDDSDDDEDTTTDTTTDTTDVTDTTVDTTTTDTTADTPVIGSGDATGTDVSDDAVFIDVSTSDPYYDAVMTAYENGLMVGIGDRLFAPDMHLTRAMAAQVIWNMAGTPGANDVAPFLDVTSDTWYAEAVAWCYENGIVVGYDDITYGPDDYLTEEQFERMLDIYKGLNPADYTGISDNATRSWVAEKIYDEIL